ncbi:MAG: DNA cytosine methyltransferase [Planctomycetota bacterium]
MQTTAQRPLFDTSPAPPPVAGRTALEFFAGVGLARIGLEQAGWRVVLANDLDAKKRRMYEGHFGPSPHLRGDDIHALAEAPSEVPDATLAHASFPCTDLSLAGARRGIHAGQSSAYWGFHRLLQNLGDRRPPLVLLENVTGFLSSRGGEDFRAALASLNELGYAVDAFMLDAAHFVPQSRPRLFVVGFQAAAGNRPEETSASRPAPTTLRPARLLDAIAATPDINWALNDLPEPPPYGQARLESILDDPPDDSPQWWEQPRADYLLSQMSERHRAAADKMIAGRRWSYGGVFRRVRNGASMAELRTDGLAGCLRTPKGGSGRQILFKGGFGRFGVRLLNARECARLMGAGDYRIEATLNQALFGFGDAVCVDCIRWIADNCLNRLADQATTGS